MTRKDYELIAKSIKAQLDRIERMSAEDSTKIIARANINELAANLVTGFETDNSRFDASRFLKAAGF